jgi:hypothetical protein
MTLLGQSVRPNKNSQNASTSKEEFIHSSAKPPPLLRTECSVENTSNTEHCASRRMQDGSSTGSALLLYGLLLITPTPARRMAHASCNNALARC